MQSISAVTVAFALQRETGVTARNFCSAFTVAADRMDDWDAADIVEATSHIGELRL